MPGRFVDAGVPALYWLEVEVEVGVHLDLPALGAKPWQRLAHEAQPACLVLQLEGFAGLLRERFAAAQSGLQAERKQLRAEQGLLLGLTADAQALAVAVAHAELR